MKKRRWVWVRATAGGSRGLLGWLACSAALPAALAGTLVGHVRDPNWYARRLDSGPYGVGYYEYAVNANGAGLTTTGGADATDVFGAFALPSLAAGAYTVVSWDVWWRSAYAFGVQVPANGTSAAADLRLHATMWGYPAFWDDAGHHEFGQTFVASGPITMIYLRDPLTQSFTRTVTVHAAGPAGAQVGRTRTYGGGGDHRLVYGQGELPTLSGETYYLRIRTPSPAIRGVLMQMEPRPDSSDPMPGGCLWLGDGTTLTAHPDRDLGVVIMADDDGLITGLFARRSGNTLSGASSVGQTFVAQGAGLISAAFWLADPSAPTYVVRCLRGGPGGPPVGTLKRSKPARLTADPELIVAWAPGECPLTSGAEYYLEVTKDGGGVFNEVYANHTNPFPFGQAYRNGTAMPGADLAGTLVEEVSPGSAALPAVRFASEPTIAEAERGTRALTIRWSTDVPATATVEYALDHPPYQRGVTTTNLATQHAVTLAGLKPHALYHYRVRAKAAGHRPGVSRDLAVSTRPEAANLLANPGFETGSGPSPRATIPGWTKSGTADLKLSDGTWFWGLPPRSGQWLLEGAVNGSASDAVIYQRVPATAGRDYTFSAWITTWMRENDTWKYDVWQERGRLISMRLGIDPGGGTNPLAASVQWTPRVYSHRHYSNLAKRATATGPALTLFISMKGDGGQWHLYGVDDCVLTKTAVTPPVLSAPTLTAGSLEFTIESEVGQTNRIDTSVDLAAWSAVTNFVAAGESTRVRVPIAATTAAAYYRAVVP